MMDREEQAMEIGEILKQHQAWLKKANASLASRTAKPEELRLPLDVKRQHIDQLKMRVEQLAAQKEAAVKHYDASIARSNEQLALLETELSSDEKRLEALAQTTTGHVEPVAPEDKQVKPTKPDDTPRDNPKKK
jgi:chromosome segregation ATPase